MTAKRFNRVGGYVYDGDKCISHFEDVAHRDDIVKLLNELHEENTILKTTNGEMEDYLARLEEENQRLQKKLDCITKSLQNELNQYGGFR